MHFFPFLHFFTAIVFLYLAVYIFVKNPKATANRVSALLFLCFTLWSAAFIFFHNPDLSKESARLSVDISALGWGAFSSFYLWFILAFTGKTKLLKKKWLYLLLFGMPVLFIYKQWTNFIFTDYINEWYGWRGLYGTSIWPYLFFFYYLAFMGIGLYINFDFLKKTRDPVRKKQAKIIFFTMLTALGLGSFSDVVFTLAGIHYIPNIANVFVLVWGFGTVYAMVKYKFLTITPATAADNIISTMFDCLILLSLEGVIVAVNTAGTNVLGYREDELKGKPLTILPAAKELDTGLAEEIVKGELKDRDIILKTKTGDEIPVLFSSSVLRDETGAAGGIVCVAKDISGRKKLEEEIFKGKKLESIGLLAAGIAHDFNNLLSIIIGNLTMAQEQMPPGTDAGKFLNKAEEVSAKASELATKFITFSPGGWLTREPVALSHLLDTMKDSGLPGAKKNVSYDIDIPGDLMPINGDEEQLTQVMQNLFLNAVDAVPDEGGKITIGAENVSMNAQDKFLLKKGKYVKISIGDNGTGIPADILGKIFDPYFTTREKTYQKGLGLGLTVCYSIVKKHDGHIDVESSHQNEKGKKGTGTTVTLYLPAGN